MTQQIPMGRSMEAGTERDDGVWELTPDLASKRLVLVNVLFVGANGAGDREWVLIDAGLPLTAGVIKSAAASRFGADSRPGAIVMTHGHFDHVGALETLAGEWDVPVYAHPLEHPYLNGTASYPPPDPAVGGGIMSTLSPMFPRGPVDVAARLHALPEDGTLPLLAADAVITTAQESAYAALLQEPELHGPPMYYTQDWPSARRSAETLAALEPELLVTGHGRAMQGEAMRLALHRLAETFDQVAHPPHAKYADHPLSAEDGSAYVRKD